MAKLRTRDKTIEEWDSYTPYFQVVANQRNRKKRGFSA